MDDEFAHEPVAEVSEGVDPARLAQSNAANGRVNHDASIVSTGVQQPKPQALPTRTGPSSILVSPRQKGNPILNSIRALPWEYSDIPADFVLGVTTCALFLSLKYHRLHPEYIYSRIRGLAGKYNLRILLTMVDIQNHEDSLKELSKTSLINNVTIILCWSAQEAGRYLELFKSFEHAAPTSIKAHQSTTYPEKLVEFITIPRSINKTDAVGLVSSFGSLRTAVNARPEEVALVAGWGEKKVQRWCGIMRENFRVQKAARRGRGVEYSRIYNSVELSRPDMDDDRALAARFDVRGSATRSMESAAQDLAATDAGSTQVERRIETPSNVNGPDADEDHAAVPQSTVKSINVGEPKRIPEDHLSEGISAALERLRRSA